MVKVPPRIIRGNVGWKKNMIRFIQGYSLLYNIKKDNFALFSFYFSYILIVPLSMLVSTPTEDSLEPGPDGKLISTEERMQIIQQQQQQPETTTPEKKASVEG